MAQAFAVDGLVVEHEGVHNRTNARVRRRLVAWPHGLVVGGMERDRVPAAKGFDCDIPIILDAYKLEATQPVHGLGDDGGAGETSQHRRGQRCYL